MASCIAIHADVRAMPTTNAICLKFGTLYGPQYVNRLYAGIVRHADGPVRFFCMTDDATGLDTGISVLPLPHEPFHDRMFALMKAKGYRAPFQKISMFRPDLIPDLDGPLLVFDVDVAITGPIGPLRDYLPGKIAMRRAWNEGGSRNTLGHGSVEKIEPKRHRYLYDFMASDPETAIDFSFGSEQTYTSRLAERHGDFVTYPDEWIVSFKYDCRPARPLNLLLEPQLPKDARVVCFHGRPKIEEAIVGYRAGLLKTTRACSWLKAAWEG